MILTQILESAKQTDTDLFVTDFGEGLEVVFSLPTFREAVQLDRIRCVIKDNWSLMQLFYSYIFDRYVSNNCIIKSQNNIPAGIESSISELILLLSGIVEDSFEYTNTLLEFHRSAINNMVLYMKRTICSAFYGYKFSDLENLNYQQLIEIFVNAEQSLLERGIIEKRITFTKPGEEKQQTIDEIINQDLRDFNKLEQSPPVKNPRREQFIKDRMAARSRGG